MCDVTGKTFVMEPYDRVKRELLERSSSGEEELKAFQDTEKRLMEQLKGISSNLEEMQRQMA
jgi:chaperonin cofactor prefoldin